MLVWHFHMIYNIAMLICDAVRYYWDITTYMYTVHTENLVFVLYVLWPHAFV